MMPQFGAKGAPPTVPITAIILGAMSALIAAIVLAVQPGTLLQPLNSSGIVALVHLVTIGCVGLTFAGTLQQLPAVMLVTHLRWPRLGVVSIPLLIAGAAALVLGFVFNFHPLLLTVGGTTVVGAWALLVAQLLATAISKWPKDAGSLALILAMVAMLLTVSLGLILAHVRVDPVKMVDFGFPRTLHYTVGLFGAFLLGIVGAGQKLFAMFALSKGTKEWRVRVAITLITIGILFEAIGTFTQMSYGDWPILSLSAGALFHLLEMLSVFRGRLRKKLDGPVARFFFAHAFLVLSGVLLVFGHGIAATVAFLGGFVVMVISGMAIKIVSFLIWTAVFTGKTGGLSGRAPLLRDLVVDWLEPVATWGLAVGVSGLIIGVLVRSTVPIGIGGALLTLGAAAFVAQLVHVVIVTLRAGRVLERQELHDGN